MPMFNADVQATLGRNIPLMTDIDQKRVFSIISEQNEFSVTQGKIYCLQIYAEEMVGAYSLT